MGNRVGIMGGTFNPIHYGHLRLALTAQEQILLDKVLFMPSGTSYMKSNVLETQKRVDMVALAIEEYPQFELSLIEAQKTGNTYTFETLQDLKKSDPDTQYFFIIGADSLFQLEQWRCPELIFDLTTLVCAVRDDYTIDSIRQKEMRCPNWVQTLFISILPNGMYPLLRSEQESSRECRFTIWCRRRLYTI